MTSDEWAAAWRSTARGMRARFRTEVDLDWMPIRVWCELGVVDALASESTFCEVCDVNLELHDEPKYANRCEQIRERALIRQAAGW